MACANWEPACATLDGVVIIVRRGHVIMTVRDMVIALLIVLAHVRMVGLDMIVLFMYVHISVVIMGTATMGHATV